MSRFPHPVSVHWRITRTILFPGLFATLLLLPATGLAGVIAVVGDTYSLDGGRPDTGVWEIAEKLAVARDVAIVVVDKNVSSTTVQILLQLLETLKIPTLLTKKADYKVFVDRGIVKPAATAP